MSDPKLPLKAECQTRNQIRLGKMFRSREEWRVCVVCGYDDLINNQCGGDYYTLNMTICPECGVVIDWEN
jgi:hypothetical protein